MSTPQQRQQQPWMPGIGAMAAGGLGAYKAGTRGLIKGMGSGSMSSLVRGAVAGAPPVAKAVALGGVALGGYALKRSQAMARDYDDR